MVFDFSLMLFHVSKRPIEPFFFASEEHKADGPPRVLPGAYNGVRGAKRRSRSRAVVSRSFAQVPGIQVPAHNKDFFRMLAPANLSDNIGSLHGATRKRILHVEAHAWRDAPLDKSLQLTLIFPGHGHNRNGEVRVKAQNPRVRQVHAGGLSSALPADDRDRARRSSRFQKIAEHGEEAHFISIRLALRRDQRDFSFEARHLLDFVLNVEHVDGHYVALSAS